MRGSAYRFIVGLGGIAVEILHDIAVASAPVSRAHVRTMIENLKTAPLFTGARGKRPLDVDAIAAAVERISWLAHDLGPRLLRSRNQSADRRRGWQWRHRRRCASDTGVRNQSWRWGMRKVIDLECDLPPDETGKPRKSEGLEHPPGYGAPEKLPPLPGHGFGNYANIFTTRKKTEGGAKPKGESLDSVVARMKKANIVRGVVGRIPNSDLVRMVKKYPDNFICLAEFSAYDGMRGVRALEDIVRNHGIHGFRTSSLYTGLPASDRRYYPLYAKCVELDIPVRIYTAMSYANDRPYDLGHPRHLDQVAMDFPELRIVAGLSGWPWVNEMVGLLRRHPNLYADTASHRPRHFRVTRLRLGNVPAIRQHAAAGQDHDRAVARKLRRAL